MSEKRNLLTFVIALAAMICVAVLTGCGGGSSVTLDVNDDTTPAPVINDDTSGSDTPDGSTASTILPLGTPIPAIPTGMEEIDSAVSSARSISSLLTYPGSDYLTAAGATVVGDELVLQSSEDDPAWAMYRADGLTGMKVTEFMIDTFAGEIETEYSVGFSNYDDGEWEYYLTTNMPEAMIDLSEETTRLISSLGNCYWLIVVEDGASVKVAMSQLYVDDDPGVPGDPGDYPCPFFGEVESIGDGYFNIRSEEPVIEPFTGEGDVYRVDYTAETLWFTEDGQETGPEMLALGGQLIVDAIISGDTITAEMVQEINFEPVGDPGDCPEYFPLEGEIAAIGNGVITLADDSSCDYDDDTEWLLEEFPGGPEDLEPGDYVMVDCLVTEEGTGLLALMVMEFPDFEDDPGDPGDPSGEGFICPFDGTITAIGEYYIQLVSEIEGENVEVIWDAETLWLTEEGDTARNDFEAGDFIHIDALETEDGGWLALAVFSWDEPGYDDGDPVIIPLNFIGEIEVMGDGSFTFFDGIEILYDDETQWFNEEMLPITADDIETGDFVMVEALIDEDGNPLAVVVFLLG